MPSTITITEPAANGSLLPLSSPASQSDVIERNGSAVTITSYLPLTTTVYAQDSVCNLSLTVPVTTWSNFTTTIYTNNVTDVNGLEATISGTRYTTIYQPDVTITLSGSTVTACAYDDFDDDDDDGPAFKRDAISLDQVGSVEDKTRMQG